MELPVNGGLQSELALAIFALYVVGISLCRLLSEQEFFRLTAMKKAWGRSRGLLMHFLANVALPMVFAVVFFSRGAVGVGTNVPYDPIPQWHAYNHLAQGGVPLSAVGSSQIKSSNPPSHGEEAESVVALWGVGAPCP